MSYIKKHDMLRSIISDDENIFVSGDGAELIDEKGNRYLDLCEMEVILGQNNPNYNKIMNEALLKIIGKKSNMSFYKEALYKHLINTTNGDFKNIHLMSSGSEATEWAVKVAHKLTGKSTIISFWNSIHGRTHLSASMSGLPRRKTHYDPLSSGILFGLYPNCLHCKLNQNSENCNYYCLDFLDEKIKYESTGDIAALIIEPYQANGIIMPPKGYLKALREWTKDRGILLIFDEIQSGMGRTGEIYYYQQEDIKPDMLLLGKGFGNGLHISALLTNDILEDKYLPALAGGSGDSSLSCASAFAVFEELFTNNMLINIQQTGEYIGNRLGEFKKEFDFILDIRGKGLIYAIEFKENDIFNKFKNTIKNKYITAFSENTVIIKPPFCFTQKQAEETLDDFYNIFKAY